MKGLGPCFFRRLICEDFVGWKSKHEQSATGIDCGHREEKKNTAVKREENVTFEKGVSFSGRSKRGVDDRCFGKIAYKIIRLAFYLDYINIL